MTGQGVQRLTIALDVRSKSQRSSISQLPRKSVIGPSYQSDETLFDPLVPETDVTLSAAHRSTMRACRFAEKADIAVGAGLREKTSASPESGRLPNFNDAHF